MENINLRKVIGYNKDGNSYNFLADCASIPIISSMDAGNKPDPTRFGVADIYETSVCPLAKVMRKELKKEMLSILK